MRSQPLIIVLLAVVTENVSAGLVRYQDRPVRAGHYVRSFNQSSIAADPSQPAEPSSITSSFSLNSMTTQPPSTTNAATSLSKQIGSVPAEGSGPSAAKIDPESFTQRSSSLTTASSSRSAPTSSRTKQIGSVPAQGSGPGAATFNLESFTQAPSSTTSTSSEESTTVTPVTTSTLSGPQKVQSAGESSSQSTSSSASATTSVAKPASTLSTRISLGTGIATPVSQPQSSQVQPSAAQSSVGSQSTLSSQSSSIVVAESSLASVQSSGSTSSSGSTAASSTQAGGPSLSAIPVAKGGNVAIANAYNQQFKTLTPDSSCSLKDRTQAHACINGLFAECNDAGRYTMTACAQDQQCFALPMPAGSTGIFVQCDKPSDANQKLQLGNASSSASIVGSPTAVVASSQTGNPTTGFPTISVSPMPKQSQSQDPTTPDTLPSTTQTASQIPSTLSVTQPAPAGASNAGQPDPAPSVTKQSSATATASSTDVPLIISFPSSLSSSPPQPSVQPSKPTRLQNPAPAPAVPSSVATQQPLTQPSPSQQPPTSIPTIGATTASAAAPGITIVPLGNDDDKGKEKTVTVTVTTTERL